MQASEIRTKLAELPPDELVVVQGLAEQKEYSEIAESLDVSPHTIRNIAQRIYRKFGLESANNGDKLRPAFVSLLYADQERQAMLSRIENTILSVGKGTRRQAALLKKQSMVQAPAGIMSATS